MTEKQAPFSTNTTETTVQYLLQLDRLSVIEPKWQYEFNSPSDKMAIESAWLTLKQSQCAESANSAYLWKLPQQELIMEFGIKCEVTVWKKL